MNDSTIFIELFSKLSYENWPSKLEKMNWHAEESNANYPKRITKLFSPSEFLIGHVIIIGTACYSQQRAALFLQGKDNEDAWDSIAPKARFD